MRAVVLEAAGRPPRVADRPDPVPGDEDVLIDVGACGLCRTDLHIADGEVSPPAWPVVPGHQIVGRVSARGLAVRELAVGDRVGVPWLAGTCGRCKFCARGQENLCPEARFTGLHRDGGLAERAVADARYCVRLPDGEDDAQIAPLLCAGLIGYRCLVKAGTASPLGLYGFGAAAHLVIQLAVAQGRRVFVFTRAKDAAAQELARSLGAEWAGGSEERPPAPMEAALLFAPVGALVPAALAALEPGGHVVCGGIHMSDIPSFPYRLLWPERVLSAVANLTREDARDLFAAVRRWPVQATVTRFPLERAPQAFTALRSGQVTGAVVIEAGGR